MERAERTYQLHIGQIVPEIVYQFNQDTVIFPLRLGNCSRKSTNKTR
jgi:hypothetical protein